MKALIYQNIAENPTIFDIYSKLKELEQIEFEFEILILIHVPHEGIILYLLYSGYFTDKYFSYTQYSIAVIFTCSTERNGCFTFSILAAYPIIDYEFDYFRQRIGKLLHHLAGWLFLIL